MKTHMKNTHLLEISNSTQSLQTNITVIRHTMSVDDSIDRGRSKNILLMYITYLKLT